MILSSFPLIFVYFVPLVTEKVVLASEYLFWPANGVRSIPSLVEIHNIMKEILWVPKQKNILQENILPKVKSIKQTPADLFLFIGRESKRTCMTDGKQRVDQCNLREYTFYIIYDKA